MARRHATIASSVGLHARPAAVFVRAAAEAPMPVMVGRLDDVPVPASSILAVMGLGIGAGESVVLQAEGDDAEPVLDRLVALLQTDHDA